MLAEEAFDVLERVRNSTGLGMGSIIGKTSLISTIFLFPRNEFKEIRDQLFVEVKFTNKQYQTPTILAGNVNQAFADLDAIHIYEMFLRAFARNFFSQFRGLLSRINQALPDFLQQNFGISTHSLESPIDAGLLKLTDLKIRQINGEPLIDLRDVCKLNEILIKRVEDQKRSQAAQKRKDEQRQTAKKMSGGRSR